MRRITVVLAGCLAFVAAMPALATPAAATSRACGPLQGKASWPAPPAGYAVVVEASVGTDCTLTYTPGRIVPISQMPASPSGVGYVEQHGAVTAGDPEATVYQRSWDCCNILMNGLYTTLVWNAYGSYVVTTNQWNTTVYHTEAWPSRGWWLDYQQLWYSGGCNYCWSRTVSGKAGYGYQGGFDPTGQLYYNTYLNTMEGKGDGSWSCTWQWWWRNSFLGWHTQDWCANGYNP